MLTSSAFVKIVRESDLLVDLSKPQDILLVQVPLQMAKIKDVLRNFSPEEYRSNELPALNYLSLNVLQ